jgi:DNA-binding MarR family transcriptional regulator
MSPGEQLYVGLIYASRRLRELDHELGLSPARFSLLATLRYRGPQKVGRLAQLEAVSQPTVSKLINALEQDGLVQRRPDAADGRACLVQLSPAGRALVRRARARKIAYLESAVTGLDPAGVTAMAQALRQDGSVIPRIPGAAGEAPGAGR